MQDSKKDKITLRIGTRASPLALVQAREVKARLINAHGFLSDPMIEIIPLSTRGDRVVDRPLMDIGGKGLFTEEIETALRQGHIDMAAHSLKDMPTILPDGLTLACILRREDARDAFICAKAPCLDDLPAGALIGTASLRRQAQSLSRRHDVTVTSLRGNVQTRLRKLEENIVDATYLAMAGLNRLDLTDDRIHPVEVEDMLPAVAQGAICIEIAHNNNRVRDLLQPLNHRETEICVTAERAMLRLLDGDCRTPIAGHATMKKDIITLQGWISLPDGSEHYRTDAMGTDPEKLGIQVGQALKDQAGEDFFGKLGAAS